MKPMITPEFLFAVESVQLACSLAEQVAGEMAHHAQDKEDRSPVTVADFAVQALISSMLEKYFPSDCLVGEESTEVLRQPAQSGMLSQITEFTARFLPGVNAQKVLELIDRGQGQPCARFWILDPVDGTKGFLRGEHYAVALALLENGRPTLSVLGCPRLGLDGSFVKKGPGIMAVAQRGGGAWIRSLDRETWSRLQVSTRSKSSEIRVLRSVEASHANADHITPVFERHGICTAPILMDSQAKYAFVAQGQSDLFFYLVSKRDPTHRMKIWDVAPGALVVEEAGGKITDLQGRDLDFTQGDTLKANPGLVITNGHCHDVALAILKEASS